MYTERTGYSIAMFPCDLKSLPEQSPKLNKCRTIDAPKHLDIFGREFERSGLKPNVSRCIAQHKAKVNMHQVSISVKKNVTVMTVFDLEEVCYNGIPL